MTLQQVKYFLSVAELKNFSKAAKKEHISQPAISKQIKELEFEYGCDFFVRSTHNVQLTTAGKEFYSYAKELVSMDEDIHNRINIISRGRAGQISIIALGSCREYIINSIKEFCKTYPEIQLLIEVVPGAAIYRAIKENSFDLYFTMLWSLREATGYSYIKLPPSGLSIIYPISWKGKVDVHNLSSVEKKPFAYFSRNQGTLLWDFTFDILRKRDISINVSHYYNSAEAVITSVEAGIGFTIMPDHMFDGRLIKNVCIEHIPWDDIVIEEVVAWKTEGTNTSIKLFVSVLKELYGNVETIE